MHIMSIVLEALATLTFLLVTHRYIIHPLFLSPLSKIPNAHFTAPLLPWISFLRRGGRTGMSKVREAHQKHGPIVRLSPDELSVLSLDGLSQIYGASKASFQKSGLYHEFMNFKTPNLVSTYDNKAHGGKKRMLAKVYTKSYLASSPDLKTLSRVLLEERLLSLLRDSVEGEENGVMDVYSLNQAIGSDFMSAYLFGLANSTDLMRDLAARAQFNADIRVLMKGVLNLKGKEGHEKARERLEAMIMEMCKATSDTMASSYPDAKTETTAPVVYAQLSSQVGQGVKGEVKPEVASEMLDHMIAGHVTTQITLTYIQHHLSLSPSLQTRLRNELLTLPSTTSGMQDLDSLPLLDAVIKETLRLHPPTPDILPRLTPPGGAVIEGYFVPGGTKIGVAAHCLHMNPSIFPAPEEFRPERWMGEGRREKERWFWAFSSGGRMCIGNHFALFGSLQSFRFPGSPIQ